MSDILREGPNTDAIKGLNKAIAAAKGQPDPGETYLHNTDVTRHLDALTEAIRAGGGGGDVTKAYVDQQDALLQTQITDNKNSIVNKEEMFTVHGNDDWVCSYEEWWPTHSYKYYYPKTNGSRFAGWFIDKDNNNNNTRMIFVSRNIDDVAFKDDSGMVYPGDPNNHVVFNNNVYYFNISVFYTSVFNTSIVIDIGGPYKGSNVAVLLLSLVYNLAPTLMTINRYGVMNDNGNIELQLDEGFVFNHVAKNISLNPASSTDIKALTPGSISIKKAITVKNVNETVFYGLAKIAGDTTMAKSSNPIGTYTDEAKTAIQRMIGLIPVEGAKF